MLENTVASQLQSFFAQNNRFDVFQSGFRLLHSTETALEIVVNDLLLSSDSGSLSILLLPDLSSAFDTVYHDVLLSHLSDVGVTVADLSWLTSYLIYRQFYISMQDYKLPTVSLK